MPTMKSRWFFKVGDCFFNRAAILAVTKLRKPKKGTDGIDKHYIVTVTPDTIKPPYNNIWVSDVSIKDLLEYLEQEVKPHAKT